MSSRNHERESPLKINRNLWINNQAVEKGTYDRVRTSRDSNGQVDSFALRRPNLLYDNFPYGTLVEAEYIPSTKFRQVDRRVDKSILESGRWGDLEKKVVAVKYNWRYHDQGPHYLSLEELMARPTRPGAEGFITTTPHAALESDGMTALKIKTLEDSVVFFTEEITAIFKNHQSDRGAVVWMDADNQPQFYVFPLICLQNSVAIREDLAESNN